MAIVPIQRETKKISPVANRYGLTEPNDSQLGAGMVPRQERTSVPVIMVGHVRHTLPGIYSCEVFFPDGASRAGVVVQTASSSMLGAADGYLPPEGTRVLALVVDDALCYIIGMLPSMEETLPEGASKVDVASRNLHADSESRYDGQAVYKTPATDPDYMYKRFAASNRPADLIPGEHATLSDGGAGLVTSELSAELRAGGAHLRVSSTDNTVRVAAGMYQRFLASGLFQVFNDHGFISEEGKVSPYFGERLGKKGLTGSGAFTSKDNAEGAECPLQNKKPLQTAKARLKSFSGTTGSLLNLFALQPDPSSDPLAMDDDPNDRGVMRMSVGLDGAVGLRSTGGIAIERYPRIPVPHRKREAWDPEGETKPESVIKALKPFKHSTDNPYYRRMELIDSMAWDTANAYRRFVELEKDFSLKEETDDIQPKDTADEGATDSKPHEVEKFDERRSGIYFPEDGSVVIRDAWGSEIVMAGGVITMSAASNIHILPGKTAVVMAGDDIALKARNSVDVVACKHDVRVKAQVNLQMAAGSDSQEGGVVIESFGKGQAWDAEGGEDAKSHGILLRALDSFVSIDTLDAMTRAEKSLKLWGGDESAKGGKINITSEDVTIVGSTETRILSDDGMCTVGTTAKLVGKSSAQLVGGSTSVISDQGFAVPLKYTPVGITAGKIVDESKAQLKQLTDDKKANAPFDIEAADKMRFAYRTSKQCGTDKAPELTDAPDAFTFYQPAWVQLWDLSIPTVKDLKIDSWDDGSDCDVEDEKPWPGRDALESGKYATSTTMNSEDKTGHATSMNVDDLLDKTDVSLDSLTGYEIPKTD